MKYYEVILVDPPPNSIFEMMPVSIVLSIPFKSIADVSV